MYATVTRREDDYEMHAFGFNPDSPVYVVDIGWHKTPPKHLFGPAVRPYYLLHLIVKGKGSLEEGGKVHKLEAGSAFLIRPDETTTYWSDEKEPWEYYWISFYGHHADELMKITANERFVPCGKSGVIALQNALTGTISDDLEALHCLFTVLRSIHKPLKQTAPDPIATTTHYLENNYFKDVDIGQLASQLGFSRAYFSTLFQKRTGESPYHYLTKIRLQKAKEYLRAGNLGIEEIAFSVGFSCVSRFSELFKKYEGVSPLQYRKN